MGDNVKAVPMMKIRAHRELLADSMKTMQEIPATLFCVREYIQQVCANLPFTQEELESINVKPYSTRPDTRIGWDETFIVTYLPRNSKVRAVFGMCSHQAR